MSEYQYYAFQAVDDPEQEGISRKAAGKLIEAITADVEKHIATNLVLALHAAIAGHLGDSEKTGWSLEIDNDDPQTVNFHYPTALARVRSPLAQSSPQCTCH
jgi:hypothetical protein